MTDKDPTPSKRVARGAYARLDTNRRNLDKACGQRFQRKVRAHIRVRRAREQSPWQQTPLPCPQRIRASRNGFALRVRRRFLIRTSFPQMHLEVSWLWASI